MVEKISFENSRYSKLFDPNKPTPFPWGKALVATTAEILLFNGS
jgi:hypothetical protein